MNSKVTSGYIEVEKVLFRKESIKPGSYLRRFLGLDEQWSSKVTHIQRRGDLVRIDYMEEDNVYLGEDFNHLVSQTRLKYEERFKGKLVVSKHVGRRGFIDVTVEF